MIARALWIESAGIPYSYRLIASISPSTISTPLALSGIKSQPNRHGSASFACQVLFLPPSRANARYLMLISSPSRRYGKMIASSAFDAAMWMHNRRFGGTDVGAMRRRRGQCGLGDTQIRTRFFKGFLERLPFHRRPQIDQVPADVFRKIPPDARFMARNAHFQRRALFASDAADPPFRPAALAIGEQHRRHRFRLLCQPIRHFKPVHAVSSVHTAGVVQQTRSSRPASIQLP